MRHVGLLKRPAVSEAPAGLLLLGWFGEAKLLGVEAGQPEAFLALLVVFCPLLALGLQPGEVGQVVGAHPRDGITG